MCASCQATIAVVDANEDVRDSIAMVLSSAECRVQTYANAAQFLSDFERLTDAERFSALIIDPSLPANSAIIAVRRVFDSDRPMPIIGLTARPDSELSRELKRLGAQVLLTKPVSAQDLLRELDVALQSKVSVG